MFISYRRDDCMNHAGRLAENLQHRAQAYVFLDIESIPPGVDFAEFIEREIASCDVVLVLIGDDWLSSADAAGHQRIADPKDWVHLEIASALERGVLTIPVLVEGATMPRPAELPEALQNLALRNAVELRDRSWPQDVDRLIVALPRPSAEHTEPDLADHEDWPVRFTDSWFAANVPQMHEQQLRALRAELYKRSWSDDEISSRVWIHKPLRPEPHASDPPTPPGGPHAPPAGTRPRPSVPPLPPAVPAAFPSRFTDSWFAINVPQMDQATIDQLLEVLRTRSWSDQEISDRVLAHANPEDRPRVAAGLAVPGPPSLVDFSVVTGQADADDPVAQATLAAAVDLAELALDPTARIRERQLALALARHLPNAEVERKLHVPGWDPQPGNVDVFTRDRLGRPDLIIETKLKEGDQVFECLWDMAKALSLATEPQVDATYLVTGSTAASWRRPVACAEFFETGQHDLVGAIGDRYRDLWVKYILGDSRGRPREVPDLMDVTLVADIQYPVHGVDWQLKAIRVSAADDANWVRFRDGLPHH